MVSSVVCDAVAGVGVGLGEGGGAAIWANACEPSRKINEAVAARPNRFDEL